MFFFPDDIILIDKIRCRLNVKIESLEIDRGVKKIQVEQNHN